jgi:hypothetical protein
MGIVADGSTLLPDNVCAVNEDYIAERKACSSDADCSSLTYQALCCTELLLVGIAKDQLRDAQACMASKEVVCACAPGLERAEDGRVVNERGETEVRCIEQQCTSRVSQRLCGAKQTCAAGEICVSYENVPGGPPPDPDSGDNAYLTFRCEPNPCANQLACECARRLCDAHDGAVRMCEIKNNAETDMTCRPFID